jgi:hypothetical protein
MGQPRESDAPPIRGVLGYLPGRFRPVYAILEARPTGNLFFKAGNRGAARLRRFGSSVLSRIHQQRNGTRTYCTLPKQITVHEIGAGPTDHDSMLHAHLAAYMELGSYILDPDPKGPWSEQ